MEKMVCCDVAYTIGTMAYISLLEEVYTTPKPGLVDLWSCGAHTDMDVQTFEKSAWCLRPFFIEMANEGYTFEGDPETLFSEIRQIGIRAEKSMYKATEGVNTHKGSIFTMGIFCAAVGRCIKENHQIDLEAIRKIQLAMTERVLSEELHILKRNKPQSNGEKNLKNFGTLGIRGEAVKGYPSIWLVALPVLLQGEQEGREDNLIKLQTLMALMSRVEDSNIIARKGPVTLKEVQRQSEIFLNNGGAYAANALMDLKKMDQDFTQNHISAGGCADLLAASIFIKKILQMETENFCHSESCSVYC